MTDIIKSINFSQFFHSDPGKAILFVILIFVLSFLINYLLSHSIIGGGYRIFVAPGIIVHEMAHATLCLITGAKIKTISLFDKEGGIVEHTAPKVPVIGQILISLAPIFAGSVLIFLLSKMIGLKGTDLQLVLSGKTGAYAYFSSIFSNLDLHQVKTLLILYFVISIAVTMTPSLQDIRNIALSILGIFIVTIIIYQYTSFRFNLTFLASPAVFTLLGSVIVLLILCLVLSIIVYAVSKIFKVV